MYKKQVLDVLNRLFITKPMNSFRLAFQETIEISSGINTVAKAPINKCMK